MKRYARWLAAGCLALCAALPSRAATIWVGTTGADNRCLNSPATACPTANAACGRCSNNASIICSGSNNAPCGGGGTTCISDGALGPCRNNICGTSTSLACKTIERGAVQSTTGDTLRVLAGTYRECIGVLQPINGFEIVADAFETSQNRTATVIDGTGICDGTGSIFRPAVTLGDGASIRGFTVRGGGDAGIRGLGSVVITQNIVTGNQTGLSGLGGGVFAYSTDVYPSSATLRIENNDITGNVALLGGGGIYVEALGQTNRRRPVLVANNVVRNNTTTEGRAQGAGILVRTIGGTGADIPIVVTQNTVEGNSNLALNNVQASYGGGIAALGYGLGLHTIDITNNSIKNNNAGGLGGGIAMLTSGAPGSTLRLTASGNTVEGNTAVGPDGTDGFGGGIWCETLGLGTETIDITRNAVRSNTTFPRDGGGIAAWAYPAATVTGSQKVTVASNIVTGNQAANAGGGVQVFLVGADLPATAVAEVIARDNTITGNSISLPQGQAGGLFAIHESQRTSAPGLKLTVERNTITGNSTTLAGAGAVVWVASNADPDSNGAQELTTASVQFQHNVITGNHAVDAVDLAAVGGGFFTLLQATGTATATLQFDFNTVFDNDADNGAGGIEIESQTALDATLADEGRAVLQISNSIVADNLGTGVGGPIPGQIGTISDGGTGNLDVTAFSYNDVFGNDPGGNYDAWFGNRTGLLGNVSVDPQLNAAGVPVAMGGRPAQCSGSVNRGDPALPFSAEPSPNGNRVNIGHLGGTSSATTSLADVNGDFSVDGVDVLRIATSFASSTGQPRYLIGADIDRDGQVDGDDLALVATQFGTSCN